MAQNPLLGECSDWLCGSQAAVMLGFPVGDKCYQWSDIVAKDGGRIGYKSWQMQTIVFVLFCFAVW